MSKIDFMSLKTIDFCDDVRDGTHDSPKHLDSGKLLITSKNIKGDSIDFENASYISEEDYNKINERSLVEINDVLYSMIGTVGLVYRVDQQPNYAIKNMGLFKIHDELKSKWLYYYLNSPKAKGKVLSMLSGSTQKFISLSNLRNLEIEFPQNIDDAKRIIKICESIDKKIKLNNEINNNLYELSQKIYNRWFVDFEYPISLNQTYKFNDGKFKEVDGLVVPNDFRVCKLDEICDCQNGHAFYKEGYDDSGLMVIDLGNVSLQGNFIYTNADKYINRNRIPNEKFIVKKNDLVMIMTDRKATMDLLGKTAKIYEDKEYALNQRIYRIRPTINVNYVYSFLNSSSTLDKLKGVALGSVQKYVNTNHINDLKIVVPSAEIMSEYSKVVDPIFKRMEENILESRNLEIMRDSLLTKLMNGEIDLDNIEI